MEQDIIDHNEWNPVGKWNRAQWMKAEELMMTQSRSRMADGRHCVWAKGSAEHRYRRKRRICELARKEAVEEWWCGGSRGDCARPPVTPHNANPDPLLLCSLLHLPTYLHWQISTKLPKQQSVFYLLWQCIISVVRCAVPETVVGGGYKNHCVHPVRSTRRLPQATERDAGNEVSKISTAEDLFVW